jgi:NAD(P)-dependent dehydrogenase (short-subunit alcohol dehydrogenase family)
LAEDQQPVKPLTYSVIMTIFIGLTRYFSTYWTERVRINTFCPEWVEVAQPKEFLNKISNLIPIGEMPKYDEYRGAILFMLSDVSLYLNSPIIPMESGRSVW